VRPPTEYQQLAQLVAKYHPACHNAMDASAEEIVSLLENTDAFRREDRFKQFLVACEAEYRSTHGEQKEYGQAQRLLTALTAAKGIDVPTLLKDVSNPMDMKKVIHQARVAAVEGPGDATLAR
jgi:tRNA nucleotidyltransferase (CCA-adding enzyme)